LTHTSNATLDWVVICNYAQCGSNGLFLNHCVESVVISLMELKILCIGDVVGSPGRRVLTEGITAMKAQSQIDCVVVNAENATDGAGLSGAMYDKIVQAGANLITLGDHVYRRNDIIPILERATNIVRPANMPIGAPGKEFAVYHTPGGHAIAVISVLGRMFMKTLANCPFAALDRALSLLPSDVKIVVVDIHAEATSEKMALGWFLDGRVSVVFGTHTHVPTADERILPKGTAYITDVGMTGPYDSVLGRDKHRVVGSMISGVPSKYDVAEGDARLCGLLVSVGALTGSATGIERIQWTP